jgi:glycosyltransferase involved in cell wall biosynthesis
MKNILFIHQSAELYGSDKVLRDIILGLDRNKYHPIVILPNKGVLFELLKNNDVEVHVSRLGIISRANNNIFGILKILNNLITSIFDISKIVGKRNVSIVHSNTIVVLSGAIWACLHRKTLHIWHIHEIIHKSPLINNLLRLIVQLFSNKIICDSKAVLKAISNNVGSFHEKSVVIWNGYAKHETKNDVLIKERNEKIIVLLVGRFNRMKGQLFILECIKNLQPDVQKLFLFKFIGSPPTGQEHYLTNFIEYASEYIRNGIVEVNNFTDNIERHWSNADIAIVPSIEPEAFGLVAIEAMAHHLPVIASDIGGLKEIIVHNETGFLFEPKSVVQFCECLTKLSDAKLRKRYGEASYIRYLQNFTLEIYKEKIFKVYDEILN